MTGMDVCPTEIVRASPERVWDLLTDTRQIARWSGTRLVQGQAERLAPGDRLVLRAGVLRVTFQVLEIRAPSQLTLDVTLPLGVTNHERIQITSIGADSCRVTFN